MYAIQGAAAPSVRPKNGLCCPIRPSLLRRPVGLPVGRRSTATKAFVELHDSILAASTSLPAAAQHAQALYTVAEGGPVDLLAQLFETILQVLDEGLEKTGVPYAYGFAIIALTVLVKLGTFPLTQKQVESTLSMQAMQPRLKELQAKYANNPEKLQLETTRLYQDAGVNPLAGCLPTLATIPVFIGLYQALTRAANDGLLTDGFFWIPSLAGPVSLEDQKGGAGLSWLFPFVDGHPPIGWANAGAYLVMPVLLVLSQYVSQKIISSQNNSTDPSQQQAQAILKFLPLMIGWFSLNVPSGLTLYWFVNNVLSTAQQLYLKATVKVDIPEPAVPEPAASTSISSTTPTVKPKEERIKAVIGKDTNARKKKKDGEVEVVEAEVVSSPSASTNGASSLSGKKKGGDKFRALKAREAAAKAKAVASVGSSDSNTGSSGPAEPPTGAGSA